MSNPSEFIFKDEARNKLFEGIQKLTKVVAPYFAHKEVGSHFIDEERIRNSTLDLINTVHADDPFVEAGIELGKDLAKRVYKQTGDGITTSLLCMNALVERGMQHIRRIHNFLHFRSGIEKALKVSLQALEKQAFPMNSAFDGRVLRQKLSYELDLPDEHLAMIEKIAGRGIFIVEQSTEVLDQIELSPAISVKVRVASPYFLQEKEQMSCELNDVLIAMIEGKVESVQELLHLLKWVWKEDKSLLLIADDFSEDLIASLVLNHLKRKIRVCALKPPKLKADGYGAWKKLLEESCHLVCMKPSQLGNLNFIIDSLGFAKKVFIRNGKLSLFSPNTQKFQKIDPKELFSKSKSKDKEELYLATRIQLKEEINPIKKELRQKRMRKTFKFIEEVRERGMVLGGGIALYSIIEELEKLELEKDENLGADCVKAALAAPLKQIVQTSGLNVQNVWKKLDKIGGGFGVDLRKKKIVPVAKEAIFDSLNVLSTAIEEAVNLGSILLTSEAIVTKGD